MNPSQYPLHHQNYYITGQGQLGAPQQMVPEPNNMYPSNFIPQQPMNPSFHIDNSQHFQGPSMPMSQPYQSQPSEFIYILYIIF